MTSSDDSPSARNGRLTTLVLRAARARLKEAVMEWPGGKPVAVALTFDVDAEVGWNGYVEAEAYARRITLLSEGTYGPRRGLPRILDLLDRLELPATFFIPGKTAERHPAAVEAILTRGHEVGHHGYLHIRADGLTPEQQREEIEKGVSALVAAGAPKPSGYRGPSAELTPETLDLLVAHGFTYDSTCMGDDRPYFETFGGRSILEIPISHSLIDFVRYNFSADFGGNMQPASALYDDYLAEYEFLCQEGGGSLVALSHPEIIGRAYRMATFEKWVTAVRDDGNAWFATMSELAEHARPQLLAAGGGS